MCKTVLEKNLIQHIKEISFDFAMFIIKPNILVPVFGFQPVNVYMCNRGPDGRWGSWQMVGGCEDDMF